MVETNTAIVGNASLPSPRLPPLQWAAKALATLITQIDEAADEGKELKPELVAAFKSFQLDVREGVDHHQALAQAIKGAMVAAREYRKQVDAYVQRLKLVEEVLKEDTLEAVKLLPDVELRGHNGKKVYTQRSAPSLRLGFDVKEERTFSNIVDPEMASFLGILPKYLVRTTVTTLDTDAVKADLKAGVELDWAKLEQSSHIRGL